MEPVSYGLILFCNLEEHPPMKRDCKPDFTTNKIQTI